MKTAVAYLRTSSATNVGVDKDSDKRQHDAIVRYASYNNISVEKEYYDAAVKGTDQLFERPGFSELYEYVLANKIDYILVESASRFSRSAVMQMVTYESLQKQGISLVDVNSPSAFLEDTDENELIRGIFALLNQFDKKTTVRRMRKARDRKRQQNGRCEGRKPPVPEAVLMAKDLRKKNLSYEQIGLKLAEAGYTVINAKKGPTGIPYKAASVRHMLLKRKA